MSSTPQFNTAQLEAARTNAWRQSGDPLLTLDAAREWIMGMGLVLFAPRPQHILAPAPTLVEATLGAANDAPAAAQIGPARSFVARLAAEGSALPLNLLGGPGELPDFIVSAQMFSFVFTLRGDKLWKQPPATSGTVKVTPLALGVYERLSEKGAMSAAELASELGREITEAAVLRSLNELWTHMRVIPSLEQAEAPALWELTSKRFTKAIKAGVNAGQPTALSALVSLYLSQALLATEEEIAAFLSPLAARSRIREVVHGLSAARQLEPVVLEGKTLLHIPGTLPEFPAAEEVKAVQEEESPAIEGQATEGSRIRRFTANKERGPRDFKGKPAAGFGRGERKPFGERPRTPSRQFGERTERNRRPFRRDASPAADGATGFTRPWNEDRKPRAERPVKQEGEATANRPYERSARPPSGGLAKRGGFTRGPSSGERRDASDRGTARKSFGGKPPFRKERGESFSKRPGTPRDGERKPYVRRDPQGGERPAYGGSNSKPRTSDSKRPYPRREDGASGRPPRLFDRSSKPGGDRPKRPYVRRDEGSGEGPSRPAFGSKRPYTRREDAAGDRPARSGFAAKRPDLRHQGANADRPSRPSFSARGNTRDLRARSFRPAGDSARQRPSGPRGDHPSGPPRGKFGSKPAGPSFGKREGSRAGGKVPFGGKPAFGRRPARNGGDKPGPRKPRPEE